MKKTVTTLLTGLWAAATFAAPHAQFSTDQFENFTLHTYASFDAMADVSFIVESKNKLVVIEPQAFEGKVEEFTAYTEKLGKPVEKVLVSFHAAGLKAYPTETKAITKPMAGFMKSDRAKGMLAHFDQAFGGAMDTEIVAFDEILDVPAVFTIDGVDYKLEPTSVPGMPGVNIAIDGQVYYQHFAPSKNRHASQNQISSKAAIDGALIDALKAKAAGYTLLLGSHGIGKAGGEDLGFQISYLETLRQVAAKAQTAGDFIAAVNKAYPDCGGAEDLNGIAAKLYPVVSADRSEANKKAAMDFFQLLVGDHNYEAARAYAGEYVQHDPKIGDGYDALVAALKHRGAPKSKVEFKNVAADGDLVYLQTHREMNAQDDGSPSRMVVIHVFRFNDDGKIDEHWVYNQSVKLKDSVSKHPLF
jgi:predicted SnoaL-like aldol condensation-catalyzing enzyme